MGDLRCEMGADLPKRIYGRGFPSIGLAYIERERQKTKKETVISCFAIIAARYFGIVA